MRLSSPLAYLLVLCAALVASPASAQSQDTMAAAQRLVVRSGLSVQLRGFANQFATQFGQHRGTMPDAIIAELSSAAKEAFRPDVLQEDIVQGIAKKLKVDEMNGAIAWLETPVGRRVTLAEELASTTMDEAAMRKYGESLKDKKPSAARSKLITDIVATTPGVESTARKVEAIALGVALGIDSTQPVEKRVGLNRLQARIRVAMPPEEVKQQLRATLPGIMSYTYRDVSDADLAAYVVFLRSPLGKRYQDEVSEAYTDALIRASVRLGQLVDTNSTKRPI